MTDGRTKAWWMGFLSGFGDVICLRKDVPEDIKAVVRESIIEFNKWEASQKETRG